MIKVKAKTNRDMIDYLCVKCNLYEFGDDDFSDYDRLLDYVEKHKDLSAASLDWIAKDIQEHSEGTTVEYIKNLILIQACTITPGE